MPKKQKPKVEGGKPRQPFRPIRNKEHTTKVVGLETHTFDIRNRKYAAKFKKLLEAIANYVQHEYKGGLEIAMAMRDLLLPIIDLLDYPTPKPDKTMGSRRYKRQRGGSSSFKRMRNKHICW